MKILMTMFLLTTSINAFATGGFHCTGKFKHSGHNVDINLHAGTGRVEGNPMITNLFVNFDNLIDRQYEISKQRVVGYWNADSLFMLNVADRDYNESEIKLLYNTKNNKGTMTVNLKGNKASTKKVSCLFE